MLGVCAFRATRTFAGVCVCAFRATRIGPEGIALGALGVAASGVLARGAGFSGAAAAGVGVAGWLCGGGTTAFLIAGLTGAWGTLGAGFDCAASGTLPLSSGRGFWGSSLIDV